MAKIIKTFVQRWTIVKDVGPTLHKCYTNACVRQVATLYYAWSNYMKKIKIIHEKMFIGGHMYHVALPDWLRDGKC